MALESLPAKCLHHAAAVLEQHWGGGEAEAHEEALVLLRMGYHAGEMFRGVQVFDLARPHSQFPVEAFAALSYLAYRGRVVAVDDNLLTVLVPKGMPDGG